MTTSTPPMSMNKVIHAAVRRDLDRFRRALDGFRDGDRDRAAALHRAWVNFDAQLTEHHEGEHEIAWPVLEEMGIGEATIASFDAEHEQMAADLAATREAMQTLLRTATRADADVAAAAMERLQATTVAHLDHEEQETEPVFAQHAGDPALKEMGRKFGRRMGAAGAGVFFVWMQDGATAEEKSALADSVPRPVLAVMGGLLGRRYRKDVAPVWRR
jgi:hemerythrin-like domain-containing protein